MLCWFVSPCCFFVLFDVLRARVLGANHGGLAWLLLRVCVSMRSRLTRSRTAASGIGLSGAGASVGCMSAALASVPPACAGVADSSHADMVRVTGGVGQYRADGVSDYVLTVALISKMMVCLPLKVGSRCICACYC